MSDPLSLAALADGTILSPFTRLRHLLDGVAPGHDRPIDLTLGEPATQRLRELYERFEFKSWLGEFGQGDRWRFCLTAAGMARAQERR